MMGQKLSGAYVTIDNSRNDHVGPVEREVGEFDVINCQTCGFRHVMPLPSEAELAQIYKEEYYATEKPLYFVQHEEDREWWNLVFKDRYDVYEAQRGGKAGRILDVGSGPGLFLAYGQARGWDCLGIEPSRQSAQYSRDQGISIVEAFLDDDVASSLGRFDVIHLSQVLEHIPDPLAMLERLNGLLDTDGLLQVVVPNDFNPFQQALDKAVGLRPWWIVPPHHLNYFDFDSLERALVRCGFEVVDRTSSFPIDMFLLMGDTYIDDPALGRACHGRRKNFDLNLEKAGMGDLRNSLYRNLATLGIGREVSLLARKANPGKKKTQ